VPALVRALARAQTETEAERAYFGLEGACFPQRLVTQSCVALVSSLLAALASEDVGVTVRAWLVEAIRGIVGGTPLKDEVDAGNAAVVERCRKACLRGVWLLYGLYETTQGEERLNLAKILTLVDDEERWQRLLDGDPWSRP
jgi:hypothetical protein